MDEKRERCRGWKKTGSKEKSVNTSITGETFTTWMVEKKMMRKDYRVSGLFKQFVKYKHTNCETVFIHYLIYSPELLMGTYK